MPDAQAVLARLRALADPANVEGMARFGIRPAKPLGVSVTTLRKLARPLGKDHALARDLWASGFHEARILATMVDEPAKVTRAQMDRWAKAFDSWDVCDQACANLFDKTPFAVEKAVEWSAREREFEKRAGFALMAALAWHDKDAPDSTFRAFLPHVRRGARDERNFVRKAASWALRQTGKRNAALHALALKEARALAEGDDKAARWVGRDAMRDLERRRPA